MNEIIMGIDDGEITKYYELKEASFLCKKQEVDKSIL